MRSFSKLKAFCSFPETLPEKPKKRRDDAAALGKLFHSQIEDWAAAHAAGTPFLFNEVAEPVRGWIKRMRAVWTPPPGLETEVALGLEDLPFINHVPVKEDPPDSHEYHAIDGKTPLLTAGRSDLQWMEGDLMRVCDIKTGQFYLGAPAKLRQLQAQGFAALSRQHQKAADSVKRLQVGVYYARTGYFDWSEPLVPGTTEWVTAWRECRDAAQRDQEPHPGAHCLSCYDKKDCPANPEALVAA